MRPAATRTRAIDPSDCAVPWGSSRPLAEPTRELQPVRTAEQADGVILPDARSCPAEPRSSLGLSPIATWRAIAGAACARPRRAPVGPRSRITVASPETAPHKGDVMELPTDVDDSRARARSSDRGSAIAALAGRGRQRPGEGRIIQAPVGASDPLRSKMARPPVPCRVIGRGAVRALSHSTAPPEASAPSGNPSEHLRVP